ncbi:MAG: hypothetical protein AB7O45_10285 [Alphaproteobacteria bacterium]
MGDLLVRKVDDETLRRLKQRAEALNMSLSDTARAVLADSMRPSRAELLADMKRIRAMSPPIATDSTDLIREDRDSR